MKLFTAEMQLNYIINNRLPNDINEQDLANYISIFKYPCGCIPYNMYYNGSAIYNSYTMDENYEYFNTIFAFLKPYYTADEYEVIIIHATVSYKNYYVFDKNWDIKVKTLLNQTNITDKEEIQYLLEDIQYLYLESLLHNESQKSNPEIPVLLQELSEIEDQHNNFTIGTTRS